MNVKIGIVELLVINSIDVLCEKKSYYCYFL